MDAERWETVESLFRRALTHTPGERERFLRTACEDDSDLRREVSSLLASYDIAGSFLDQPALDIAIVEEPAEETPARIFVPDEVVADRFQIVRFLAEGGMGEVYEALDLELQERVALKTIRQSLLENEEAETRFMREIQLARRVTHPNVSRIYDVFHHKVQSGNYETEIRLLSMELLTGETLAKRLTRSGPMPVSRVLAISRQIAEALRAAHDAGIVHRDLKPENVIMVPRKKGLRAVVTDFGLARAEGEERPVPVSGSADDLLWTLHGIQSGGEPSHPHPGALQRLAGRARRQLAAFGLVEAPDEAMTEAGRVLGTPAYMSPEQGRGAQADERSDVWSWGVVVYEMLTGERPYLGHTPWGRWIRRWTGQRPSPGRLYGVPASFRSLIFRCLELRPEDRFENAEVLVEGLNRIVYENTTDRRSHYGWIAIALAALGVAALYFLLRS